MSLKELEGKILAVDTFNLLYQFLTTIRARDGSAFTDSHGNVTSHLLGVFNRTTKLMETGIKLIFVFDGQPPAIKQRTREIRAEAKKEAKLKYEEAKEMGDVESMYKFAGRTIFLNSEMIADAKRLIEYLGCPIVQAPSEGEAQCAHLVKKEEADYAVSQDYDSLIFGCPLLVRNLSIEGKRKKAGRFAYQTVSPEMVSLSDNLNNLSLDIDQLIVLAILVGTDYNPGGVKGIGPKTGLKLLKEFPHDFDAVFEKAEWSKHYSDLEWKEIFYTIKKIPVTDDYVLEWKPVDGEKLKEFLVKEHDFSEERVDAKLKKLIKEKESKQQSGLGDFF
ncbi:MAG: flap endonuclease-1 [Candidatus Woesearchaeota archaeon]